MADNSTSTGFAENARLFVIELRSTDDSLIGYAIAERTAFLGSEESAANFPGMKGSVVSLEQAFKGLMAAQRAQGIEVRAAALPATFDPRGRGLTVGAPASGSALESTRGAPAGPPSDDR